MSALGVLSSVFQTMLSGIRTVGSTLLALPFRLHFIFLWFIGLLFLLFNASAFYGEAAQTQQIVLILYMSSLAFVFGQTKRANPLLGVSSAEFIIWFGLSAAAGVILLKSLPGFTPGGPSPILNSANVATLITHALVVAISEELLFRYAFPSLVPGPPMAGQTISAILFGVMHWTAYGGSWPNVIFAMGLGLVFGSITVRFRNGLFVAMGLHFAFNATVLGFT